MLLLCDGHCHLTYSIVKKSQEIISLLCLPPNTSHALQPLDFFAPLKYHWKKILKNWLRESRHKNVDKSVIPTSLNTLFSKINSNLLKSGFNGNGLYPADKSKPMKIMNTHYLLYRIQPKHDEVDKSNQKEDVIKNLQRASESVLTPSPSEPILIALVTHKCKKRRACVQAKKKAKF